MLSGVLVIILSSWVALSEQRIPTPCSNAETCHQQSDPFEALQDPTVILKNLKEATESVMKDSMLSVMKATVEQMVDLPQPLKDKLKDEAFLKEKIDFIIERETKLQGKDEKEGDDLLSKVKTTETSTTATTTNSTKWAPYGGQARIYNWQDFYRHFPHLATKTRLWKLEFKEAALKNAKKFGGCANPARLVDWLVPDIEDVKRDQSNKNKKQFK